MTQTQITEIGNQLIIKAQRLATLPDAAAELQYFYENMEAESRHLGGTESMPLGWVGDRVLEISVKAGVPIHDKMAPPPHN